jgi:hypothetical protein
MDRLARTRLYHNPFESLEIGALTVHAPPTNRSVEDVINEPRRCYSGHSRHDVH